MTSRPKLRERICLPASGNVTLTLFIPDYTNSFDGTTDIGYALLGIGWGEASELVSPVGDIRSRLR